MGWQLQDENAAYCELLCSHLNAIVGRLRKLSVEQWDRSPHIAAPTPRVRAAHAWQWLQCDRMHID